VLETLKGLGRHSLVYGLGALASKLLAFVLLPVYTRYLTPDDYGVVALLTTTGAVAALVAELGLGSALFWSVIYRGEDERRAAGSALVLLVGQGVLLFGGLAIVAGPLAGLIFGTAAGYAGLLRLVFLTGLLGLVDIVFLALLRIRERAGTYAAAAIGRFALGALLNVLFIVVLRRGVEGLVVAGLLTAAIAAGVELVVLARAVGLAFDRQLVRRMLGFGAPLMPANVAGVALTSADRYFLQAFDSAAAVGIYAIGYSIGMAMNLAVQAVQLAWPAQMFAIAKRDDAERQLGRLLTHFLVVFGFAWLVLSVYAREIVVVMTTPRYYEAAAVVPLVTLAYVFYGVRMITNTGLMTRNRTSAVTPLVLAATALNLALNVLLIPRFGILGAASATALSYGALMALSLAANQAVWRIDYEPGRLARIVAVCAALYLASLAVPASTLWLSFALKTGLLATYPLLLAATGFFTPAERELIGRAAGGALRRIRRGG